MSKRHDGWVSFKYVTVPRVDNPTPFAGVRFVNVGETFTQGLPGEGFMDYADKRFPRGKPYRVSRIVAGTLKVIPAPSQVELAAYLADKDVAEGKKK